MNASHPLTIPGDWHPGVLPTNAIIEDGAYVETSYSFLLHRSHRPVSVEVGRGASIYQGTMFDLGPQARVTIGPYTLVNGAWIICDAEVSIGAHTLIAWNVVIMDTYRVPPDPGRRRWHLREAARRRRMNLPDGDSTRAVHIGPNVWIGFDCCILPGVTIGDGAVVGARSVVTTDVPPGTVFAGNPARLIRRIESSEDPIYAAPEA